MYKTASVTVSEAVDGTKKRKPPTRKGRLPLDKHIKVMPMVLAVAKRVARPGETVVIVSETCVRLVPKSSEK